MNMMAEMHQRMEFPPAVVVGVEEERLEEEQPHVREKGRREHAHQVGSELRIQNDEHERQERAEGRGQREGDREQLRELVREPVVSPVFRLVADRLDDEREERNRQHERREQQMELCDRPDRDPAADDGEFPVLDLFVRLRAVSLLGVGPLGSQSVGAGSGVDGGRRNPVWLFVLAVHQVSRHLHGAAEHHDPENGTENEQHLAVHRDVHLGAPLTSRSPPSRGRRRLRSPPACAGDLERRRRSPTCPREGSASDTRT
jgi:hypothetical protein